MSFNSVFFLNCKVCTALYNCVAHKMCYFSLGDNSATFSELGISLLYLVIKRGQVNPLVDKAGQPVSSEECEKLRSALVAAQESAAVQLLLECCLPRDEAERVSHFVKCYWYLLALNG